MSYDNEEMIRRIEDLENEVQILKMFNEYHSGRGVFIKTETGRELCRHLAENDFPFEVIFEDTFRMPEIAYQNLHGAGYAIKKVSLREAYTRQPGDLREKLAKKYGKPKLEKEE